MHSTAYRPGFSATYLERICPLPRPMRSLADWTRHIHADLETLTDRELAREGRLARQRADLDWNPDTRAWFEGRATAIDAEIKRRRAALTAQLRAAQRGYR